MEQSNNLFELHVDHNGSSFLREIAKWSKFLAIVGFVMMGLTLLAIIFAGSTMATLFTSSAYGGAGETIGMIYLVVVVAILLLYFFPCLYLFKFATKMQVALRNNDQDTLNSSFENLKSCFKFVGIFTIIILSIYGLIFVFAFIAALTNLT
ncbi:MAG: hypothetical protein EOO07_25010 [Chitinophagaceae bacterium]|nr:MAG: hypothetical protein EOO07_25010 [Chitinophagaceae bacterium]